ncbi:MAG TPA: glycosyltransferase family 2 protein [Cyclobacteriaceae bacterium]|nr:glycosyltransferase family 2 protein [Cyclobacteriaceae bacterium]
MGTLTASLLISTYNWPEALELCLLSAMNQTRLPDEILIADDGSTDETKRLIAALRGKTKVPIRHFWHEDLGFRKTLILNEAIRHSNSDYIIQTDGDILLHPRFIEEHVAYASENYYLRGSRTLIDEETTKDLLKRKQCWVRWFDRGISHRMNAWHSSLISKLFSVFNNPCSIEGVKGCNFSFWKKDFVAVNGFNNDITGWGREDSELAIRLINKGILKKHLKFRAVCFHLHHNIFSRDHDERNMNMLNAAIKNKSTTAENGFSTPHPVLIL